MLVQARLEIVRDVGPAAADIDAAQFETRQQRYGVDLVLGEFLPHTPHARVEQRQRLLGAVEIDQEEGEVPPVVGVHERVAAHPGVGHRFQEGHALQHLAARFQAMGDGVMRPGIAAVQDERLTRHRLGLVEAIALLQAEGIHGVDVAVVAIGFEQMLADAQQRFQIAAIEGMELAELAGQKIARPLGRHVLVDPEAAVGLAGGPRLGRGDPRKLARVGVGAQLLCAGKIALRACVALGRIHRQHEVGRHHRQQGAALFLVGGGDELGQPVGEAQPLAGEEIERGDRLHAGIAHLQPLTVPRHACPRCPNPGFRCPSFAWRGRLGKRRGKGGK